MAACMSGLRLRGGIICIATVAWLTAGAGLAQQGRSSYNNRGTTSGTGSSLFGSQSRSGLGQQGASGQNGTSGSNGQSAFGQDAQSQSAIGDEPLSEGLRDQNSDPRQQGGFVGRDAEDVRTGFESMSGGERRGMMMDMMIENLNEMRDSRRRWREQQNAPPPIRVRLQPAFDLPVASPVAAAIKLQTNLTRTLQARGVVSPQVEIAGRTAFLRGSVATAHDRELAERLASFEPGVSRVENLLTVQAPPAANP